MMTLFQDGKWYVARIQHRRYATTYKIIEGPYDTNEQASNKMYELLGIKKS